MRLSCFLLPALLIMSGCERQERSDGKLDVPEELAILRSNALQCWQDSSHAPVENSEHCVVVSEGYFEAFRTDCDNDRSYDCMNRHAVLSDVRHLYSDAIIESLVNFGVPDWIRDEQHRRPFSSHVYYDGELMRRRFEKCLEIESEHLAKAGLQRVTSIMERPLQEGQRCFRLGYPEFETAPVT